MKEVVDATEVLTEKEVWESLDTHSHVVSQVTIQLMMIFGSFLNF